MATTNNIITEYRSKEAYDKITLLTLRPVELLALQRAKRERAIALDRSLTMTANLRRRLKAVSDRLMEALVKYEDYVAKALIAYSQFQYTPQVIEITFWIDGDKDHKHLGYPEWYYKYDYKPSRQQRMEIAQLEKEMAAEPNWIDVNDALYSKDYRTGDYFDESEKSSTTNNINNWLKLRWSPKSSESISQIISTRAERMQQLIHKDTDGISQAFYQLKDIYCLALEDMLDITRYEVDLHAEMINY